MLVGAAFEVRKDISEFRTSTVMNLSKQRVLKYVLK